MSALNFRTHSVPLLNALIASLIVILSKARTAILQVLGLAFLDLAAFQVSVTLGFLAVGISLFVVEALTGE